jgi:hypothetical protein
MTERTRYREEVRDGPVRLVQEHWPSTRSSRRLSNRSAIRSGWKRPASPRRWAAAATPMTMPGGDGERAVEGRANLPALPSWRAERTWNWPRWSGWIGSTIAGSSESCATRRLRTTKNPGTPDPSLPWLGLNDPSLHQTRGSSGWPRCSTYPQSMVPLVDREVTLCGYETTATQT